MLELTHRYTTCDNIVLTIADVQNKISKKLISNMTTLQLRIDEKEKNAAKKVFKSLGLDMSSAVKIYFKQVILTQSIPFPLLTENGLTVKQENAILKASEEAKRGINVTTTNNWEETKAFLDSLKKK